MSNPNEFDDTKSNNLLSTVGPKAAFFIVLIALSFMIGVVWKLYVGGDTANSGENVPIIRADTTPYKVDPDEPGGMEMPNKDSTIFSSLNSDTDEDRGIENLLADDESEDPVPRSQLFAGLNTERDESLHAESQDMPLDKPLNEDQERIMSQAKEAKAIMSNLLEDGVDAIQATDDELPAVEKKAEAVPTPKPEPAPVPVPKKIETKKEEPKAVAKKPEAKPEPKPAVKKTKPKPQPKKEVAKPATMGGDYYVQLASVQDSKRTEGEWALLKKKYGATLSGYKYRVETATLAKGTYYRIQAGPVSKDQATKTCNAIKRKTPGGCIVKKK